MMFCHIFDDFHLQGILAQMKQREWWRAQTAKLMYKHDYIVALLIHGFSCAVMLHIPAIIYAMIYHTGNAANSLYITVFVAMWLFHALVDHLKANVHAINLAQDQLLHIWQIVIVLIVYATPAKGV